MVLYIKNMVSLRCKMMVAEELVKLSIRYMAINLGVVDLVVQITAVQRLQLKENLLHSGLELLDNKKSILIEKIKNLIVNMVHYSDETQLMNDSVYLSKALGLDYTYLANVFSEVNHVSIRQYIILHKIEMVKELLQNNELNLTEISYKMHYSSVAHLSNQFKKITNVSPSMYKLQNQKRTVMLENV
ncbi:MAG: helix-turn-helix transcriptional regulator [Taibaiella sp.]|nr:helix-turn-helix transcriptional regulator [Taibaiella sp.]